jgi:hypothetical protein
VVWLLGFVVFNLINIRIMMQIILLPESAQSTRVLLWAVIGCGAVLFLIQTLAAFDWEPAVGMD